MRQLPSRLLLSVGGLLVAATTVLVGTPAGIDAWGTARAKGRPEPNAVVWFDAPGVPDIGEHVTPVVLDQRNQNFYPHVLAVRVGTEVRLPNNDRVFHNVFSFHDGKRFDLGLYPVGTSKRVTFDRAGISRIFCNIHPNMAAYVVSVDTPYFAVSDETGRFRMPSVPPGTYTFHAWRAGGSDMTGAAVVQPGTVLDIAWP